jgi:hypothetical protein
MMGGALLLVAGSARAWPWAAPALIPFPLWINAAAEPRRYGSSGSSAPWRMDAVCW